MYARPFSSDDAGYISLQQDISLIKIFLKGRYAVVLDAGSSVSWLLLVLTVIALFCSSVLGADTDLGEFKGTRVHVYRWPDSVKARKSASAKQLASLPEIITKDKWTKKIHPGTQRIQKSINTPFRNTG